MDYSLFNLTDILILLGIFCALVLLGKLVIIICNIVNIFIFNKCPYCGHRMKYMNTLFDDGEYYLVFKCPLCGGAKCVPLKDLLTIKDLFEE